MPANGKVIDVQAIAAAPEFKIPLRWVPSDECEVRVGVAVEDGKVVEEGNPYKVHEGEQVAIMGVLSVQQHIALMGFVKKLSDTEPTPDGLEQAEVSKHNFAVMATMGEALDGIASRLSEFVYEWNWTGMDKRPLDQPWHNPGVFKELHEDELMYLIGILREQGQEQRKNASSPSARSSTPRGRSLKQG